jgi:hypothetical protein
MLGKIFGSILAAIDGGSKVVKLIVWTQVDCAYLGNVVELCLLVGDLLGGRYAIDVYHGEMCTTVLETCLGGGESLGEQWRG